MVEPYACNVPGVVPSLNEFLRWKPYQQREAKRQWQHDLEAVLCERGNVCPRGLEYVDLRAVLYFPVARRRDADNRGALLWKWSLDSLVRLHVIPDDTPEHVHTNEPGLAIGQSEQTFLSIRGNK
jgi:hypothetical protein